MAYNEEVVNGTSPQRKFNGDYGFSFVATVDETEAGTLIIRGGLIGFSNRPIPQGQTGTAELHGTVTLSKAASDVFTQGDVVYWDDAAKKATPTATSNTKIGLCKIEPSANAETVEVLLNA